MYAPNAALAMAWRQLLTWVGKRANVPAEIIDHPAPALLSDLWRRADMACVFMCGYPLVHSAPRPIVLAAPVPSPAHYGHEPVYWTDIVVRSDSPLRTPQDLLGKRFAYTVEDSQSGY